MHRGTGYLDNLLTCIWNRALSYTEVQALHNQDSLEGELLTDLRAFYEMAVSGNTLTSTVNHPNAAATIVGANHRYEPHWCQTPTEACPEIEEIRG